MVRSLALVLGLLLTGLFSVVETYLGLTQQLGFIAALPAAFLAVIVIGSFPTGGLPGRTVSHEANLVQSMASTAFPVALAAGVFLPAIWAWGWRPSVAVLFIFLLGGSVLGFWAAIITFDPSAGPAKRLAVFPEARAVAVLLSSLPHELAERWRFTGLFVLGIAARICQQGLGWWSSSAYLPLPAVARVPWNAGIGIQVSPALLGFGYLAGPKITGQVLAGGIFSWLGFPLVAGFFAGRDAIIFPSPIPMANLPIPQMWNYFGLYLGIGALAGALIMLAAKELPRALSRALAGMGFSRPVSTLPPVLVFPGLAMAVIALLCLNLLTDLPFPGYLGVVGGLAAAVPMIWVYARGSGLVGLFTLPAAALGSAGLLLAGILTRGAIGGNPGAYGAYNTYSAYLVPLGAAFLATLAAAVGGDFAQNLHTWRLIYFSSGEEASRQSLPWLFTAKLSSIVVAALLVAGVAGAFSQKMVLGSVEFPAPLAARFSLILGGPANQAPPWALILSGCLAGIGAHLLTGNGLLFALGTIIPLETSFALGLGGILHRVFDADSRSGSTPVEVAGTATTTPAAGAAASASATVRQPYFRQVLTLKAPENVLAAALAAGDTLAGALLAFITYFSATNTGTGSMGTGLSAADKLGKPGDILAWVALFLMVTVFGLLLFTADKKAKAGQVEASKKEADKNEAGDVDDAGKELDAPGNIELDKENQDQ